jgi:hypothetical protein
MIPLNITANLDKLRKGLKMAKKKASKKAVSKAILTGTDTPDPVLHGEGTDKPRGILKAKAPTAIHRPKRGDWRPARLSREDRGHQPAGK